jgi:hypothetical protein
MSKKEKQPAKETSSSQPSQPPSVSKYQRSTGKTVPRSAIKNAEYNPRKISDKALTALKKNIKTVGLLGGIVWNERTGNIVSGHQRIKALDALEKTDDYLVWVEAVDLDEKTEREQNVFMNNPSVQGEWDDVLLKQLIGNDFDYAAAGLDMYDLNYLGVNDLYEKQSPAQAKMAAELDVMKDLGNEGQREEQESDDDYEKRKADTKELKKAIGERIGADTNPDTYAIISFVDHDSKKAFMERFGYPADEKYIKGELFSGIIERVQ